METVSSGASVWQAWLMRAAANAALRGLEHGTDHRFVSACRLKNRGVVLEMNSEAAIGWLGAPATRASFLGRFALDSSV